MANQIKVKFFSFGPADKLKIHEDAPVLDSSTSYSLINLFNKCLVEGFGEVEIDAEIDNNGIAQIYCEGHGYMKDNVVEVVMTNPTTGYYEFTEINRDLLYTVIAEDKDDYQYNDVIRAKVRAIKRH